MNFSIIRYILGWIIAVEAAFMALPCLVALYFQEASGIYFLQCAVVFLFIGILMTRKKPQNSVFYAKEGFVVVSLGWIIMSIIGCLPFYLSKEIPSFTDSLFEIISGFTTTGASILSDVEALSKCMLFWRNFSNWLGGMGVLVFVLAILPLAGGQSIYLMRAESPGPSVGKLVPKLQKSAFILYAIYFVMTAVQTILLQLGGLPFFDAICASFGTAGTGGFGIYNDSFASCSSYVQIVVTIFMVLFGTNFTFFYLLFIKRTVSAFKMEEVRHYFGIYFAAVALITIDVVSVDGHILYNLKHVAFQVASIMSTTGYSTLNFDLWPQFSRTLLVLLMFIGGCAGSTGGGIKVSRFIIYVKSAKVELSKMLHPQGIRTVKMDGKVVSKDVIHSSYTYLFIFILIFTLSTLAISVDNFDLETNFTAVAATINNIGPGLALVGPSDNFGKFSDFSKYVLMFDMLVGRLEIFPMLFLFAPNTWKKR